MEEPTCAQYLMFWRRDGPKQLMLMLVSTFARSVGLSFPFFSMVFSSDSTSFISTEKDVWRKTDSSHSTDLALSFFHYAGGTFPFLQSKKEVVRLQMVFGPGLRHLTGK